jgi:hypothetical protein
VDIKKLALLFTFAFVITGIVVYQVRRTRGTSSVAVTSGGNPAVPVASSVPGISSAPLPPVSIAEVQGDAPRPAVESPVITIPPIGWGRSPFVTVDEIAKLNEPAAPTPVKEVIAPPAPVVERLPQHIFKGISIRAGNRVAFINNGFYVVGDTIGKEVVKELKDDSVILESDGKTRELSGKTNPGAATPPKGE